MFTNILASVFTVVLLGLVVYTVVAVTDADTVKATMGFSAGLLGTIMGFYFNNARLQSETRERERIQDERNDIEEQRISLRNLYDQRVALVQQLIEDEPET